MDQPRSGQLPQEVEAYISLCGVDPQYKLPVSMLERLSHPIVVVGPTEPAQQKK